MAIKDGFLASSDEVINNCIGTPFKNQAQLLYNAAYIGFNSKLNGTGVPNYKNIKYDIFNSDTATTKTNMVYDTANNYYFSTNSSLGYYMIVEATSYSGSSTLVHQIASGKWLLWYPSGGSAGLQKAKVCEYLWSDGGILEFTSVTAIKVPNSDDVGKRGYKFTFSGTITSGSDPADTSTGTFGTTTDNIVNSWSDLSHNGTSNEIGTDTEADDATNPADCYIEVGSGSPGILWKIPSATTRNSAGSNYGGYSGEVIVFCKGTLSFGAGLDTTTFVDYYTDNSIPETTAVTAGDLGACTLIFQTTSLSTITDCISTWNSSIDSQNTLTVSVSADGTNYEEVTDSTIHRFTNTGTNLYIKFEIDRVDTLAVDKISEYAILYNVGASE